jgi:hypothetical protein
MRLTRQCADPYRSAIPIVNVHPPRIPEMRRIFAATMMTSLTGCNLGGADSAQLAEIIAANERLMSENREMVIALAQQEFAAPEEPNMNVTYVPFNSGNDAIPENVRQIAEAAGAGVDENLNAVGAPLGTARNIDPSSAWSLRGTTWVASNAETREYITLQFGAALATTTSSDGQTTVSVVDYSATNTACLGHRMCVTSIGAEGALQVQHFVRQDGKLYPVQCFDWIESGDGGETPSAEQLEQGSGLEVVRHAGTVFCLRDLNATAFDPYYAPEPAPDTIELDAPPAAPTPDELPPFPRFQLNDDGTITTLPTEE